jgi:hypothetical protein
MGFEAGGLMFAKGLGAGLSCSGGALEVEGKPEKDLGGGREVAVVEGKPAKVGTEGGWKDEVGGLIPGNELFPVPLEGCAVEALPLNPPNRLLLLPLPFTAFYHQHSSCGGSLTLALSALACGNRLRRGLATLPSTPTHTQPGPLC